MTTGRHTATERKLLKALRELLAASETVKAGLDARIDAADPRAVPVFTGIADLHAAINHARTALSTDTGRDTP